MKRTLLVVKTLLCNTWNKYEALRCSSFVYSSCIYGSSAHMLNRKNFHSLHSSYVVYGGTFGLILYIGIWRVLVWKGGSLFCHTGRSTQLEDLVCIVYLTSQTWEIPKSSLRITRLHCLARGSLTQSPWEIARWITLATEPIISPLPMFTNCRFAAIATLTQTGGSVTWCLSPDHTPPHKRSKGKACW